VCRWIISITWTGVDYFNYGKIYIGEIKQHFVDSMNSVKDQLGVADSLTEEGNISGCKTI